MISVGAIVHVVDDDRCVLTALSRVLAASGYLSETHLSAEDFLGRHDPSIPGCAVVDVNLPGMNGLDLQATLARHGVARPIIFLTGDGTVPDSVKAMKGGAVDFLTKPVSAHILIEAVSRALQMDASARERDALRRSVDQKIGSLTPREREVLGHVAAGRLNKQIAGDLGTVEKTVKVHRGRMMEKMGVKTVAELVRMVTLHRL